jgi:anti-sigma-K factor RskA
MSGPDAMRNLTCDEVREMAGAYVLGALEAAEAAAVRAHLVGHEDAHPEIAELGAVIPAFAETVPPVEPPASLKDRIMAAAAADLAARGGVPDVRDAGAEPADGAAGAAAAPEVPAVTAPPEVSAVPAPPAPAAGPPVPAAGQRVSPPVAFPTAAGRAERRVRTSTTGWLLRIAAVLVLAALGSWNLLLQNQLNEAQAYERNVAVVLDAAAEPGSLTAVLAAADGTTGSGIATVQEDGDLAIAMRDLAPTTGNSVYEAWVIGADGVPVPVGNFRVGDTGIGFLQAGGLPSAEGIVLALTLEVGPGANTPTMPIISSGVAGAPG